MNEDEVIKCNTCDNSFKTSDIKRKRFYLKDELKTRIEYFSCPKCGRRYFIGIYDKNVDSLIKRSKKNKALKEQESLINEHISLINRILEGKEMKIFNIEEKEKIQNVKNYLKEIRQLNSKLAFLLFTKNNQELKTFNFKYASKEKELQTITIQVEEFQKELNKFVEKTYILDHDEIEIVSIYVESNSYKNMIENLSKRGITEHTYTRKIPYICLKLTKLVNESDFGCVQRANNEYLKRIKGE